MTVPVMLPGKPPKLLRTPSLSNLRLFSRPVPEKVSWLDDSAEDWYEQVSEYHKESHLLFEASAVQRRVRQTVVESPDLGPSNEATFFKT